MVAKGAWIGRPVIMQAAPKTDPKVALAAIKAIQAISAKRTRYEVTELGKDREAIERVAKG